MASQPWWDKPQTPYPGLQRATRYRPSLISPLIRLASALFEEENLLPNNLCIHCPVCLDVVIYIFEQLVPSSL